MEIIASGLLMTIKELNNRKLELSDVLVILLDKGINSGIVYVDVLDQIHEINDELKKRTRVRSKKIDKKKKKNNYKTPASEA